MNKNFLALSMLATTGMFAQSGNDQSTHRESSSCNSCYNSPCCCEPCCTPKPKKCIDCECYTPSFYDLQCDWGAFFDVEFLYWYASETNTSYAATVGLTDKNTNPASTTLAADGNINKFHHVGTSWDPGVRVGLGWNSDCDGWDLYLNWTYFKNSKKSSTSGDSEFDVFANLGETKISSPWVPGSHQNNRFFQNTSSTWRVRFNQIDLEFGRKYWLSRSFTLRPFIGLRGAWTRTHFSANSQTGPSPESTTNPAIAVAKSDNQFNNRLWGMGMLGGVQPTFYFCSNFALYGNFSGALVWGEHKGKKNEDVFYSLTTAGVETVELNTSNAITNDFYMMSTLLDLGIGLRWEETWCSDRYRTALDLGWEHHAWFNHSSRNVQMPSGVTAPNRSGELDFGGFPGTYSQQSSDLGYGGFVLRARFDF